MRKPRTQQPQLPCSVLVADPPWRHKDTMGKKGAAVRYDGTMSVEEICNYKLPKFDTKAVLFLWTVESLPEEAYKVVRAWGFVPKTSGIWAKQSRLNGLPAFGNGHYLRGSHERFIIATRGKPNPLPEVRNERSIFEAKIGKHSEKPDAFYDMVLRMYPMRHPGSGSHHELFAIKRRFGWTQEGNQLEPESKFDPDDTGEVG